MTWLLSILVAPLAVLVSVIAAAQLEIFRQLADLRRELRFDDQPTPLPLDDVRPQAVAAHLPAAVAEADHATLFFLHSKCGTCRAIAEAFERDVPERAWFVLNEHDAKTAAFPQLAAATDRIIEDTDYGLTTAIGVEVTPVAVNLVHGTVTEAHVVATPKQALLRLNGSEPTPDVRGAANGRKAKEVR